jgi:predicted SAM-dependent methyltransferase
MEMLDLWQGEDLRISRQEGSLRAHVRRELVSWVGRRLLARRPPATASRERLCNLGCGASFFEGWVNADFYQLRVWKAPRDLWMVDLRYPLRCDSDYWDGVFCEHALEHLDPVEAIALLREILRTLKPGARLRLSVPDLRRYVRHYLGQEVEEKFARWPLQAAAIRGLTQGWGHRSLWDAQLLSEALRHVGFVGVEECAFRAGGDARLLRDSQVRRWESAYLEARKPG